jgi:enamine deaminase RidA (YjgF/YER057c/UK114 family)
MNSASFFVTPGYGDRQRQNLHYSQAVRHGNRVETSGQGGWDDNWCFPESVRDEVIQAFDNVERTLATAGASWRHVISVHSYHLPNPDGTIGTRSAVDVHRRRSPRKSNNAGRNSSHRID